VVDGACRRLDSPAAIRQRPEVRSRPAPVALLLAAALTAAACATPVGIDRADPSAVRAERLQNVLSNGRMSPVSSIVLQQRGLEPLWSDSPEQALGALREGVLDAPDRLDRLVALGELSFLHGQRTGATEHYLAAALYAWIVLFPKDLSHQVSPFDPRFRGMAEVYNGALGLALLPDPGPDRAPLQMRQRLPFGWVTLRHDDEMTVWGQHRLVSFDHSDAYRVRGLRNRHLRPGLGAPLLAAVDPLEADSDVHVPSNIRVPVTILLRFDDAEAQLAAGELSAELDVYVMDATRFVEIDDQRVPLEYEPTVALAATLEGSPIWENETTGLLRGDFNPLGRDAPTGLILVHPYRHGRIPLVLVHGTASSPGRWADLVNELQGAPELGDRYQIWLYLYPSGNPILFSARGLRQALAETIELLDPEGRDPALRQMVVIGHSQGGLLTRMLVSDSGDQYWTTVVGDFAFEELDLPEHTRHLLAESMFFEPQPHVERVIFLSTPHRGSYRVQPRAVSLASQLISFPAELGEGLRDLTLDAEGRVQLKLRSLPTSIENMEPGSAFMRALEKMPVEGPHHSVVGIGVRGDAPLEEADDGVVAYSSAHLDSAESELVVAWGHSLQARPEVIREVMRILALHLQESGLEPAPTEVPDARPAAGFEGE
jgi:pimeloyl-ACP methyl ester carboxylesterase